MAAFTDVQVLKVIKYRFLKLHSLFLPLKHWNVHENARFDRTGIKGALTLPDVLHHFNWNIGSKCFRAAQLSPINDRQRIVKPAPRRIRPRPFVLHSHDTERIQLRHCFICGRQDAHERGLAPCAVFVFYHEASGDVKNPPSVACTAPTIAPAPRSVEKVRPGEDVAVAVRVYSPVARGCPPVVCGGRGRPA